MPERDATSMADAGDRTGRSATRRDALQALAAGGVALAALGAPAAVAGDSATDKAKGARAAADAYFADRMASERIPGLAVAVLRKSGVIWSRGYGWADMARRIAMTPETIQNIGSVSKTFTATAVMQLLDAGRLGLDDDVNLHLGFKVVHPEHGAQPVTVRHLLSHRSAIADGPAYANAYVCGDPEKSLEDWLRAYLSPGGRFYDASRNFHPWAPGGKFSYANVPYGLLALIVERLSGIPFADYCRERIFEPLGMRETSWYLRDIDLSRHAIPYSWVSGGEVRGPSWGGLPPAVIGDPAAASRVDGDYAVNCLYNHPNFPDGFLRSSVNQLARYAQAYLAAAGGDSRPLLQASTIRQMFRVETGDDTRAMGLCWNAHYRAGKPLLWGHGGSDPGINANLRLRFEDGIAAVVLMNTNVGRPALPAPLEFADYLVEHSIALL
jgi:CubicO group peptidase (beta-lactamase class C family)